MANESLDWDKVCMSCGEGISHPVCPQCLEREMIAWARVEAPFMVELIENMIDSTPLTGEHNSCIFCGESFNVCSYCSAKEVLQFLKAEMPMLVEGFVEQFRMFIDIIPTTEVVAM